MPSVPNAGKHETGAKRGKTWNRCQARENMQPVPSAKVAVVASRRMNQSRTQSPQALWPAVNRQERLWGTEILSKFFAWLLCNGFHCFTAEILR